jgi:hypothetical protein
MLLQFDPVPRPRVRLPAPDANDTKEVSDF